MMNLSFLYNFGYGLRKDVQQGEMLIERAASLNNSQALFLNYLNDKKRNVRSLANAIFLRHGCALSEIGYLIEKNLLNMFNQEQKS